MSNLSLNISHCVKVGVLRAFAMLLTLGMTCGSAFAQAYRCPLPGPPQIRQGDSVAASGGRFDSSRDGNRRHGALDLNGAVGQDVFAARSGRVAIADPNWNPTGMGGTVILDHGDGDYTVYGHLATVNVTAGSNAMQGIRVGTVGYTGNAAALLKNMLPPHLHFALIKAGRTGLADAGGPLRLMQQWGDYWMDLGADLTGPVNPGLFFSPMCWSGSTTVGAPGER